jgi:hypothetical protein
MDESMNEIMNYLKKYGDRLDSEIAVAIGMPLAKVRLQISELAANGDIMSCLSTRYEKGKKIEGMRCRLAGYVPTAAPGRKPTSQR